MMGNDRQMERWTESRGAVGFGHREHPQNDIHTQYCRFHSRSPNLISLSPLLLSRLFIFVSCVFQNPKRVGEKNVELKWWDQMGLGLSTASQMRVSPRSLSFLEISVFSFFF